MIKELITVFSLFVLTLLPVNPEGNELVEHLHQVAIPVESVRDLDPVLNKIKDQRLVLLGESTHGTHEYYSWRAEISKQLILEKEYNFIAVEGDWPVIYEINKYVKLKPSAVENAKEMLRELGRWPHWMWGNYEILELVEWLRNHNKNLPMNERVGFYGIDMQDKRTSIDRILDFLWDTDREIYNQAVTRYGCLTRFENRRQYLHAVARGMLSCERQISEVLELIINNGDEWRVSDNRAYFNAVNNAFAVKAGEGQLRGNLQQGPESWNIRVRFFEETTHRLLDYHGANSKGIVWAHNTHVGDARATDMVRAGMTNIGQLARERHGEENVFIIGFGTYSGRVVAAQQWEGPMEVMTIPEALEGSYEQAFNLSGLGTFVLLLDEEQDGSPLMDRRGHRAIGVVYQPEGDRTNNYVDTVLPERYDAFIYFDRTDNLNPIGD